MMGFKKRTADTDFILSHIKDDELPFVLCGDFNDTPISYTYHIIRSTGLHDAFIEKGKGIGETYCGNLPFLRIDYVWYNNKLIINHLNNKRENFRPLSDSNDF